MFKIFQMRGDTPNAQIYHTASRKKTYSTPVGWLFAQMAEPSIKIAAPFLVLALLAGCASDNAAQIASPATQSVDCAADTDIFCVENNKDSAARLNRQGVEQAVKGNYDLALGLFQDAIKLDFSTPESYYNLGVTYNHKQMPVETEAAYMAGLAIQSSNPQHTLYYTKTHFNLACLYALQGKKDLAFEQLEKMFILDKQLLLHWVEADTDLDSLRDDPRFKAILARQEDRPTSPPDESGKLVEPAQPD